MIALTQKIIGGLSQLPVMPLKHWQVGESRQFDSCFWYKMQLSLLLRRWSINDLHNFITLTVRKDNIVLANNPGFLSSNLGYSLAQYMHVIQADVSNEAHFISSRHDISAIH